ncbi:hypothetical protein Y032_0054g2448 [Ancylostoma ceylanicum]|nr:hypothetical protein Y032_0054g2448 [Ancylostoma ceylanicum]
MAVQTQKWAESGRLFHCNLRVLPAIQPSNFVSPATNTGQRLQPVFSWPDKSRWAHLVGNETKFGRLPAYISFAGADATCQWRIKQGTIPANREILRTVTKRGLKQVVCFASV